MQKEELQLNISDAWANTKRCAKILSVLLCYCVCGLVGQKFVSQTWPNNWVVLDLIKSHSDYFQNFYWFGPSAQM